MNDLRPRPSDGAPSDLDQLRAEVRERLVRVCRDEEPLTFFSDPPFVTHGPVVWALRCVLISIVLAVAAAVAAFVWFPAALLLGALAVLVWVARWVIQLGVVWPARRRLAGCRVLPAVVVQAFDGGYLPPRADGNTRPFTGVVVFSFDESVTVPQLRALGRACFQAKTGPDDGPLAELQRLLRTGDHAFVHETFRLPVEMAGNDRTYATPILFQRENDLADGYLSTEAQLILAHPDRPEHVCPVPLALWRSERGLALLGYQGGDGHGGTAGAR